MFKALIRVFFVLAIVPCFLLAQDEMPEIPGVLVATKLIIHERNRSGISQQFLAAA